MRLFEKILRQYVNSQHIPELMGKFPGNLGSWGPDSYCNDLPFCARLHPAAYFERGAVFGFGEVYFETPPPPSCNPSLAFVNSNACTAIQEPNTHPRGYESCYTSFYTSF